MDKLNSQQRHKNMQAIHSKDTKIEILLRKELWRKGYRYRKNYKKILGSPDIAFPKYKVAIFCDGDFWHGKNYTENEFSTNKKFWDNKIKANKERDLSVTISLRDKGWVVLRFWESEIKTELEKCVNCIILKLMEQSK